VIHGHRLHWPASQTGKYQRSYCLGHDLLLAEPRRLYVCLDTALGRICSLLQSYKKGCRRQMPTQYATVRLLTERLTRCL